MKYKNHNGGTIITTITTVRINSRSMKVAFRIDGRNGAYRVDMKTLSFEPWEAIDSGLGFRTLASAKRHIIRYHAAMIAEGTFSPDRLTPPSPRS